MTEIIGDELPTTVVMRTRDPRRAYRVVDQFEQELADYTNAPHAVTVDSCTNGIYLALVHRRTTNPHMAKVWLPKRTYIGCLQAALNAGYTIEWEDTPWRGSYRIGPQIVDSARLFGRGMYEPDTLTVVSFNAGKQLALGRGGAILTDDDDAAEWLRAARMDGRPPGAPIEQTVFPGFHCPLPPPTAALGLWILSRWNDSGYTQPPLPDETYPDLSLLL